MLLLFICLQSVCVYVLDKLQNIEGINHCHLAAQHVVHVDWALLQTFPVKSNLNEFPTPSIHTFTGGKKEWEKRWESWMRTSTFVLLQSEPNICLQIHKWEIQKHSVNSHILWAHGSLPCSASPPVADFCNSYLDEWLKLKHSQQESHYSYLRKNGQAVISWCIACYPACKQDILSPPMLPYSTVPPFISHICPQRPAFVIDQVLLRHHWRHVGSLPTQRTGHSLMLIWCDQWDRRNKGGLPFTVDVWPLISPKGFIDKAYSG